MSYTRYRHLAIEGAKPAPSERQIHAIEETLEAKLPADFVAYLNVANGGYLEYVIDVPMGNGQSEVISFCGLFSADPGNFCDETFVGEIRSAREHFQAPTGVLPFARDGGGSIVYLDLTAKGNGRVLAFVRGLPEWAGKRTESAYIELANSFEEYVSKLRIDLEAVLDHLEHDATDLAHISATEEWLDIGYPNWRADSSLSRAIEAAKFKIASLN